MEKSLSFSAFKKGINSDTYRQSRQFSETNGGPHPANTYTRPSKYCFTGKDVLWMQTNFIRSRRLTRVDMAKLFQLNFSILFSVTEKLIVG